MSTVCLVQNTRKQKLYFSMRINVYFMGNGIFKYILQKN